MQTTWLLSALAAFFATLIGSWVLSRVLPRVGLVAVPNSRTSHTRLTTIGVGVIVPVVVALAVQITFGTLPALIVVALAMATLGFLEDLREIAPAVRLGVQTSIAFAGVMTINLPWWFVVPSVLAVVATVNGLNFMDGINGITATEGSLLGLVLLFSAWITNSDIWTLAGLLLVSTCLGYLPNNFPHALGFPGDVLPYFLGALFTFGLLDMATISLNVILGAGALLPAAIDTARTLIRKVQRGDRLTSAHRDHAYQRLSRVTSHAAATFTFLRLSILGALSLVAAEAGGHAAVGVLWFCFSGAVTWITLSRIPVGV